MDAYFETVERWLQLRDTVARLQAEERALREGLFKGTFPDPQEGVNKVEFPDGRVLKGTYKINRSVVRDAYLQNWSGIAKQLPSATAAKLIKTKYDLSVTDYRKLPDNHRQLVDQILTIKPGLPELELVPAKES